MWLHVHGLQTNDLQTSGHRALPVLLYVGAAFDHLAVWWQYSRVDRIHICNRSSVAFIEGFDELLVVCIDDFANRLLCLADGCGADYQERNQELSFHCFSSL